MYASLEEKLAAPSEDNIAAQHPYAHGLIELLEGVADLKNFLQRDASDNEMFLLV